jgi:antirestriction protein ArdC
MVTVEGCERWALDTFTPEGKHSMSNPTTPASFAELLQTAVTQPGVISQAYSRFHNYSLGNVLLAWAQCIERKIALGPIATFPKWKELGRHVKKGEKAIALCQPVTIRKKADETRADADGPECFTRFVYRNSWFVLAQTEGADVPPVELPDWDKARALLALDVHEIPFDLIDGNVMGYAKGRQIAISPVNPRPYKTLFHELAHILLGHTAETAQSDDETTPRSLREAEAESVALLCCEALSLPGADEARGYIQSWYGTGNPIPEKSAQKILKAADQILKAGQPAKPTE